MNNASACAIVSASASLTLRSIRQSGRSFRLPMANRFGRLRALKITCRLMRLSGRASGQPPPCPPQLAALEPSIGREFSAPWPLRRHRLDLVPTGHAMLFHKNPGGRVGDALIARHADEPIE